MNMRNETDEFGRREGSCENIFGNETDKFGLKKFEFSALIFAVDFRFFPCYQNPTEKAKR